MIELFSSQLRRSVLVPCEEKCSRTMWGARFSLGCDQLSFSLTHTVQFADISSSLVLSNLQVSFSFSYDSSVVIYDATSIPDERMRNNIQFDTEVQHG